MDLLAQGKSLMKELMDVTGQLEGLELLMKEHEGSKIAYINEKNRILVLGATVTPERANAISEFVGKVMEEEKREYEDKLKALIGVKEEPKVIQKSKPKQNTPSESELAEIKIELAEYQEEKLEVMKGMLSKQKTLAEIGKEFGMEKKQVFEFLDANNVSVKQYCP